MNINDSIIKVKTYLNQSYIVKKMEVKESMSKKRATLLVNLSLAAVLQDQAELARVIKNVRSRVPPSYAVRFKILFTT